jgi:hypothetical protein
MASTNKRRSTHTIFNRHLFELLLLFIEGNVAALPTPVPAPPPLPSLSNILFRVSFVFTSPLGPATPVFKTGCTGCVKKSCSTASPFDLVTFGAGPRTGSGDGECRVRAARVTPDFGGEKTKASWTSSTRSTISTGEVKARWSEVWAVWR